MSSPCRGRVIHCSCVQVVAPPHLRHCYSERLALMPGSYFVNDYKQAHMDVLDGANLPSRTEVALRPCFRSETKQTLDEGLHGLYKNRS